MSNNLTTAEYLLKQLTNALDNAFISTWQSTHAWQAQLDEAKNYLYERENAEEIKSTLKSLGKDVKHD